MDTYRQCGVPLPIHSRGPDINSETIPRVRCKHLVFSAKCPGKQIEFNPARHLWTRVAKGENIANIANATVNRRQILVQVIL